MGIVRSTFDRFAMTEVTSLLMAVLCMLGQVAGMPRHSCGVDARPHRNGICGSQLRRARDNLCFLLYADYPDHFGKRSVNEIYSYPTEAFTKMNLLEDDKTVTGMPMKDKADNMDMPLLSQMTPKAKLPSHIQQTEDIPLLSQITFKAKLPSHIKRAEDLPHLQKRGMVCDCCFNRCMPSVLARYC